MHGVTVACMQLQCKVACMQFLKVPEGPWRFLFVPFLIFSNLLSWAAHKNFAVLVSACSFFKISKILHHINVKVTTKDDGRINCPHFLQNIRLYQSSYFITCQLAFNLPIFTNLKMRNIFFWEKKCVFKDLTQSSLRPFYDSLILYIGYLSFPRVILFFQ